ncbi:MAG: universal stress protein [Saprospiraceae bacterium]
MKKILFPTDFSKTAQNALAYAIDLANRFGSQLLLLHAYEVRTTASTLIKMESYIQDDAERDMAQWLQQISPQLKNGATVDHKIINGNSTDAIADIAKIQGYDLIIMGTQGANSMLEAMLGTHTNNVLKNTEIPILAIPDGVAYRPFQTIVLAVDEIESFRVDTLKPLVNIAQNHASMVRVYHKDEANDGLNTAIDAYLEGLDRSYHYELDTDNLIESLSDFVQEYNADLLCMIRRQRTFLENVFHDSATSQEAFTAKVPLLLLHDM